MTARRLFFPARPSAAKVSIRIGFSLCWSVLVDTSLLVRTLQPHHELCLLAKKTIDRFRLQNGSLYLAPYNASNTSRRLFLPSRLRFSAPVNAPAGGLTASSSKLAA